MFGSPRTASRHVSSRATFATPSCYGSCSFYSRGGYSRFAHRIDWHAVYAYHAALFPCKEPTEPWRGGWEWRSDHEEPYQRGCPHDACRSQHRLRRQGGIVAARRRSSRREAGCREAQGVGRDLDRGDQHRRHVRGLLGRRAHLLRTFATCIVDPTPANTGRGEHRFIGMHSLSARLASMRLRLSSLRREPSVTFGRGARR